MNNRPLGRIHGSQLFGGRTVYTLRSLAGPIPHRTKKAGVYPFSIKQGDHNEALILEKEASKARRASPRISSLGKKSPSVQKLIASSGSMSFALLSPDVKPVYTREPSYQHLTAISALTMQPRPLNPCNDAFMQTPPDKTCLQAGTCIFHHRSLRTAKHYLSSTPSTFEHLALLVTSSCQWLQSCLPPWL